MLNRKKVISWAVQWLAPNSLVQEGTFRELEGTGLKKIKDVLCSSGDCRNITFEDTQTGRRFIIAVRTMKAWREVYKNRQMPGGGMKEDSGWAFHGQAAMLTIAFFLGVTKLIRVPTNMTSSAFHNQLIEDMRKEL